MDSDRYLPNAETVAAIEKDIANYNERRKLARAEVERRKPVLFGSLALGCAAVLVLILTNFSSMSGNAVKLVFFGLVGAAVLAGGALYRLAKQPGEDTRQQFRDHIIPVLFGFVDGLRYSHGYETTSFSRLPAPMKGNFNHKEFGDIIAGRLDGLRFEIIEATLKRKSKSADVTVFKGVVLNCRSTYPFKGTLVAVRRPQPGLFQAADDVFRSVGEFFRREQFETVFSRSPLDRIYEFRTNSRDEAQGLLRGQLREVLEWVSRKWPRGSPRIALRNGEIFVMLPSDRDFFELPPIEIPVSYRAHLEPMVRDFAALLAIVREIQRQPQPAEDLSGDGSEEAPSAPTGRSVEADLPAPSPGQEPIVPLLGDWEPPKKD